MKILQICHRLPYPSTDGGNIVMMNMALALAEAGHEIHQFSLNTNKHYVDPVSIPESLKAKIHFHSISIDTSITISGALKNLITSGSYNVERFFSNEAEAALINQLNAHNFDIVQLETLFATPYIECIRKNSKAKIVFRAHNVEHVIWQRLSTQETNFLKKFYLEFLASRMKTYELKILKLIDALVPITKIDEKIFLSFQFNKPYLTLPMSLDIREYTFNLSEKKEMCLFHLGSMDWMPNVEAVNWFLNNCWQKIHQLFPDLRLYLAGRNFPAEISGKHLSNVVCEGRIEDALDYMRKKQIMIVPLLSGSGMRVKIIQGLALGKTIVSTTIGAEGIPVENEKNILIADSPEDFISTLQRCMDNTEWCKNIGLAGRKFAEENYSNESVADKLGQFYAKLK